MWVKWIVLFTPLSDSINFYNGAPSAIINLILSATDKSDKYDISQRQGGVIKREINQLRPSVRKYFPNFANLVFSDWKCHSRAQTAQRPVSSVSPRGKEGIGHMMLSSFETGGVSKTDEFSEMFQGQGSHFQYKNSLQILDLFEHEIETICNVISDQTDSHIFTPKGH